MQAPPLDVLSETEFDGAFDYVVKTGKRAGVAMEVDGDSRLLINREVDRRCGIHPVQRASDGAWSIMTTEDAVVRSEGAGFVGLLDVDTSELMVVRVADLLSLARLGGNVRVHQHGPFRVLRTHRSTIASALTHKVYDLTGGGEAYITMRKFLLAEPEQFVHLHNHSIFSMLDGASSIEGIADRALANGQPGIALTDHGFMHGLFKHYHTCRERGIKPLLGCEVYMVDDLAAPYMDAQGNRRRWEYHQTLIAMNQVGWKNLCYLSSLACERHFYYVPRIDHQVLFDHSEGIICLSGCFKGMVANYMQKRQPREGETTLPWWLEYSPDRAREYMRMYRKHFGDRYYIELQNIDFEQYMQAMPAIKQMADEEGIPSVASVDCHYELAEDAYIQSIVTRISSNSVGDGLGEQASTKGCYYIRPRNEVDCPTFTPDILNRTCEIMERCTLELPKVGDPGFEFRFPKYDVRSDEDWAAFQKKGVA